MDLKLSGTIRLLLVALFFITAHSNLKAQYVMEYDSGILINNLYIQIEVTESVNAMYNGDHKKAEEDFRWLRYRFPKHPLPYFLYGLNEWWKILPELELTTARDDAFIAYMDSSIYYAEKLFEKNEENIEAAFFLAAAHGFKGRLYSERQSWTKAAFSGKKALEYLDYSRGMRELSPEFLFGDGLYNYYVEWVPENYPILRPIISFFDDGDKEKGIQQLTTVSRNAFYTRTEAQYFLMRILAIDEGELRKGLQLAEYLHETFPNNAYFHRYYARFLYSAGQLTTAKNVSLDMLQKIDSSYAGYGPTSGRYGGFFLGQIYQRIGKQDSALHFYNRAINFSERAGVEEAGYYLYSLYHAAQLNQDKGNLELAEDLYRKAKKKANRKHSVYKNAKEKLKEL